MQVKRSVCDRHMKEIILDGCGRKERSKTEPGVIPHLVNLYLHQKCKWKVAEVLFREVEMLS
jgi:hypothetical protein